MAGIQDKAVSYWPTGATTDEKGINTLVLVNAPSAVVGKVGNCYDLEASTGQYARCGNATPTNLRPGDTDFAGWAWVQLESKGSRRAIFSSWTDTSQGYALDYDNTGDRFRFRVGNGSSTTVGTVSANNLGSPSTGVWYLLYFEHSATLNQVSLRVNRLTADTASTTGAAGSSTASTYIGVDGNASPPYWDGLVDEVAFLNSLLTDDEHSYVYNSDSGRTWADLANYTASQEASGTAPSQSWTVPASTLAAGAATVSGASPSTSWAVAASTLVAGALSVSGETPALAWEVAASTLVAEGQEATGDAASASWQVSDSTLAAGNVDVSGTSPSLTWNVGSSFLFGAQSGFGQAPAMTWAVAESTIATGLQEATGDAPALTWNVAVSGTSGGTIEVVPIHVGCGGMPRYTAVPPNPVRALPITITLPDGKQVQAQVQLAIDPRISQNSQLLANVPLVDLMDETTRASVMPTTGTVVAVTDDTIAVQLPDGTVVTAAKAIPKQGQAGGYTVGQTIMISRVNGGTLTNGNPAPGAGAGTGIPGVYFIDSTSPGVDVDDDEDVEYDEFTYVQSFAFDEEECSMTVTSKVLKIPTSVGALSEDPE